MICLFFYFAFAFPLFFLVPPFSFPLGGRARDSGSLIPLFFSHFFFALLRFCYSSILSFICVGYRSGQEYGRLGLAWLGRMDGLIVLFCLSSGIHKSHGDRRSRLCLCSSSGCSGVCVFVYDLSNFNFIIITLLDSFPFISFIVPT